MTYPRILNWLVRVHSFAVQGMTIAVGGLLCAPLEAQICQSPISSPCFTFDPPVNNPTTDYGTSVAILSDYDNGGKRDIAVTTKFSGQTTFSCLIIRGEMSGPSTILAVIPSSTVVNVDASSVIIPVGQLDTFPGEEFAISTPSTGKVRIFSMRPPTTPGGLYNPVQIANTLDGGSGLIGNTFGTSMAMVETANGPRLAVGFPQSDEVRLYELTPTALTLTRTLKAWASTPQGIPPQGDTSQSFGASMAVGPKRFSNNTISQCVLTVGAPSYNPTPLNIANAGTGMVAVYDLSLTQLPGTTTTVANQFLYRNTPAERFGSAVASVGFLPEPSPGFSPLSDFVVFSRKPGSFGNSVIGAFHTPSSPTQNTPTTPTYGTAINLLPTLDPTDGRLVSAGDVDGDGLGEVVLAYGATLSLYSTRNAMFTAITAPAPSYGPITQSGATTKSLAIARGPDISGKGATDIIVGARKAVGPGGLVEVVPMAANISLPNTGNVTLRPLGRPSGGSTMQMQVTAPNGSFVILFAAFAPPQPVPFPGGTSLAYLPAGYVEVGSGFVQPVGATTSGQLTIPFVVPGGFNFEGLVFQVLCIDPSQNLLLSNGILSRIGSW